MGITPGCRLDWQPGEEGGDTVTVRVIPTRGELARRLKGRWKSMASGRDVIAELIEERVREDYEEV
jgi:hypothetical protein